jgi:hypothetical protein
VQTPGDLLAAEAVGDQPYDVGLPFGHLQQLRTVGRALVEVGLD